METETFKIDVGATIKLDGVPFRLMYNTIVYGEKENIKLLSKQRDKIKPYNAKDGKKNYECDEGLLVLEGINSYPHKP